MNEHERTKDAHNRANDQEEKTEMTTTTTTKTIENEQDHQTAVMGWIRRWLEETDIKVQYGTEKASDREDIEIVWNGAQLRLESPVGEYDSTYFMIHEIAHLLECAHNHPEDMDKDNWGLEFVFPTEEMEEAERIATEIQVGVAKLINEYLKDEYGYDVSTRTNNDVGSVYYAPEWLG